MKKLKKYDEFINESQVWGHPLESIAKKVITRKNTPSRDVEYYREQFIASLESAGFKDKITLSKLVKHPNFENIEPEYKNKLLALAGIGKSPNAAFVKAYMAALSSFGEDMINAKDERDIVNNYYTGSWLLNQLRKKEILHDYTGLTYANTRAMYKEFGTGSAIISKLDKKERAHLERQYKPLATDLARFLTTDNKLMTVIRWECRAKDNSNEDRVLKLDLARKFPDFFKFVKDAISADKGIKWESFKVTKWKQIGSEHGPVRSSSFSTTYFFDVEFEFSGKKFSYKKIDGASTYFSGGWN